MALYLLWKANRNSHTIYQMVLFKMILNEPKPCFQGHTILSKCLFTYLLWCWIYHKRLQIRP